MGKVAIISEYDLKNLKLTSKGPLIIGDDDIHLTEDSYFDDVTFTGEGIIYSHDYAIYFDNLDSRDWKDDRYYFRRCKIVNGGSFNSYCSHCNFGRKKNEE